MVKTARRGLSSDGWDSGFLQARLRRRAGWFRLGRMGIEEALDMVIGRVQAATLCVTSLTLLVSLLSSQSAVSKASGRLASANTAQASLKPSDVYLQWVRVVPAHPQTLYAGGTFRCTQSDYTTSVDAQCTAWAMRSRDGGRTWSDLSQALGTDQTYEGHYGGDSGSSSPIYGSFVLDPLVIDGGGTQLFAAEATGSYTPSSSGTQIERSADGGSTWHLVNYGGEDGYGAGLTNPVFSPLNSHRVYAVDNGSQGDVNGVAVSDDGGAHWRTGANPSSAAPHAQGGVINVGPIGSIVPDQTQPDVVYTNVVRYDGKPLFAARSDDAGRSWRLVVTNTITPSVRTFAVGFDQHLPGLLVGRTGDAGVPADRIFVSSNGGGSWQTATCPGAMGGACPLFTVDNVFGAGASYALYPSGIYRFTGGGPAGARLAVSDRLPVEPSEITAVAAGSRAGDPIYILGSGTQGHVRGLLYRSTDGGESWQLLPAGVLPTVVSPNTSPGTLMVATTHHSIAAPFVTIYRKLGIQVIGYPVDEAYLADDVLTQDFEHLQLQFNGGKVAIAPLGRVVYSYGTTTGQPDNNSSASPRPSSSTFRYFPSTKHTLQGDLLRFWQTHGGIAIFGAPITEVFRSPNGDGSGRSYEMQYFENARLERHPETRNPRYAIELGLLGDEALRGRGWLTLH